MVMVKMSVDLCSASSWTQALTFWRDLTVLPAQPRSSADWMNHIPAFAFPAEDDTHLPAQKGWNAELAWVAGYVQK